MADYSIQLDNIPTPQTYDKASAKQEAAGTLMGQSEELSTAARNNAASSLFNVAEGAVKGYAEADISKQTKEALDKFEDNPKYTVGKTAASALDQLTAAGGNADDPSLAAMKAEAQKYKDAQAQGLISQDEALTRISGAVKKWSARLPGLQSDFRKTAADLTGVSHVDIYQIHQALTKESLEKKAAERAAKMQEKYIEDVAQYHGIPPSAVTKQDQERYFLSKQLEGNTKNVENEGKILSQDAEKKGRALDGVILNVQAQHVVKLSGMYANWDRLNTGDPKNAPKRDEIARQISGALSSMRLEALTEVKTKAAKWGVDGVKQQENVKKTYDEYENLLKAQGGFDALRVAIGRREDSAKDQINRFELANPALTIMGRMHLAETLFPLWFDRGPEALIKKGLPPAMANAYDNAFRSIGTWSSQYERAVDPKASENHGPVDLNGKDGGFYNRDQKAAVVSTWMAGANAPAEKPNASAEEKAYGVHSLLSLGTNITPNDVSMGKLYSDTVNKKGMEWLNQVDPGERRAAAEPVFNTIAPALRANVVDLYQRVDAINQDPNNKAAAAGWTLTVSDLGGSLGTRWVKTSLPTEAASQSDTGAFTGVATNFGQYGIRAKQLQSPMGLGADAGAYKAEVDGMLKTVNQHIATLSAAHKVASSSPEFTAMSLSRDVVDAKDSRELAPLTPQEKLDAEATKKAEASFKPSAKDALIAAPKHDDQLAHATVFAEKGYTAAGQKDSGKGTLGKYQLTRDAVKDVLGKEYDEKKLDEYRTGPRAKEISVAYTKRMLSQFGEPLKAAAAYNMGPGNFSKLLAWAKEHGLDWKNAPPPVVKKDGERTIIITPGLPRETKAYIKNYGKAYSTWKPGDSISQNGEIVNDSNS